MEDIRSEMFGPNQLAIDLCSIVISYLSPGGIESHDI